MIFDVFIAGGLGLVLVWGARRYLQYIARANEARIGYRDQFMAHANKLADTGSLDESHLKWMRRLVINVDSTCAFDHALAHFDLRGQSFKEHQPFNSRLQRSAAADWEEMLYFWLMSVSYTRAFRGIVFRAKLARLLDPSRPKLSADTTLFEDASPSKNLVTAPS